MARSETGPLSAITRGRVGDLVFRWVNGRQVVQGVGIPTGRSPAQAAVRNGHKEVMDRWRAVRNNDQLLWGYVKADGGFERYVSAGLKAIGQLNQGTSGWLQAAPPNSDVTETIQPTSVLVERTTSGFGQIAVDIYRPRAIQISVYWAGQLATRPFARPDGPGIGQFTVQGSTTWEDWRGGYTSSFRLASNQDWAMAFCWLCVRDSDVDKPGQQWFGWWYGRPQEA